MRDFILALVREHAYFYGADEMRGLTDVELVDRFLGNHHPDLVQSAANGNVDDIVALRADLGLPIIR